MHNLRKNGSCMSQAIQVNDENYKWMDTTYSTVIKRTDCNDTDFQKLIRLLDADLKVRNGEETQVFFQQFNIIRDIDTVVLAYCDGVAAGCGCFKQYDADSAEVKRMYVISEKRGQGIAALVLRELELWAKELGYGRLVLETGTRLPEAISLYQKHGYERIANWGQYIGITESVCMGKEL